MAGAADPGADVRSARARSIRAWSPGPEGNPARGAGAPADQIFQELIQSKTLAPEGFMPCLVEMTSMGSMVTKS